MTTISGDRTGSRLRRLCMDYGFFLAPRAEEGEPLQHRVRLNFDFCLLPALGANHKTLATDFHSSSLLPDFRCRASALVSFLLFGHSRHRPAVFEVSAHPWKRMMVPTHLQRFWRPPHYLYANPLCWRNRPDLICIFAHGENKGVATVQPAASTSPPDCCI